VDLQHATIRYATVGLRFEARTALLEDAVISNSGDALSVTTGTVSFRGALYSDGFGIDACAWGSGQCGVDAAYTYWGSSAGPFPAGQPPLACGAVTTSPYLTAQNTEATVTSLSAFSTTDCGGTTTLEQEFSSVVQANTEAVAAGESECAKYFAELHEPGVCEVAAIDQRCLTAAAELAAEFSGYSLSAGLESAASVGATYLESSETPEVSSLAQAASDGLRVLGVGETIKSIMDAYDTCTGET
jgi:hypothetical protein